MNAKLTLSVEKAVIEKAKLYAKQTGKSLSEIIENYLEKLTHQEVNQDCISPKLEKLIGAINLPDNFDEKREKSEYLSKKHLR